MTGFCLSISIGAAVLAGLAGCLERTNPFDPANRISPIIRPLQDENKPYIDSLVGVGLSGTQGLDGFLAGYLGDSLGNSKRDASNQARIKTNNERKAANAAIRIANETVADPDSLRTLVRYETLDTLVLTAPVGALDTAISRTRDAIFRISERMASVNARTNPVVVFPPSYADSVLGPLEDALDAFESLSKRIQAANRSAGMANADIVVYNDSVAEWNREVDSYNAGISFRREAAKKGFVTNPESLQVAINVAVPGDTINLGAVTLAVDLRFSSGVQGKPIVIRGYPGWKTILKARPNDSGPGEQAGNLQNAKFVQFEDLVFRGGKNSGIKLTADSRGVTFHRCLFDSNATWGIDASEADLKLYNCEIRENGGGIRVASTATSNSEIDLQNVLIVRNRFRGIEAVTPNGRILNSTISDNGENGLHIASHQRTLTVTNTILSGNGGFGIFRERTSNNQEGLSVMTSDVWGNKDPADPSDDWSLVNLDSLLARTMRENNLSIDPVFIDTAAFNYDIKPESGLSAYEPLNVIGYRRKQ